MGFKQILAFAAVAAVFAVGACGDDDDEGSDSGGGSEEPAFDVAALEKQLGSATQSGTADCDEPDGSGQGTEFECIVDSDAGEVTLTVVQEDDAGEEFSYQGEASSGGFSQTFEGTIISK